MNPQPQQTTFMDIIPMIVSITNFVFIVFIFIWNAVSKKRTRLLESKVDWFKNTVITNIEQVDIFFDSLVNIVQKPSGDGMPNYVYKISSQYSQLVNVFRDNFCIYIIVMNPDIINETMKFSESLEEKIIYLSVKSLDSNSSDVVECINKYRSIFLEALYIFMLTSKFKISNPS